MSTQAMTTYPLYGTLKKRGLTMPDKCIDAQIVFSAPDEPVRIIYTCWATSEILRIYGEAMIEMAEKK